MCLTLGVGSLGPQVKNKTYIVDNEQMIVLDAAGNVVSSIALPAGMKGPGGQSDGGGSVPAAHVAQNGVAVGESMACFYSLKRSMFGSKSSVSCFSLAEQRWHDFPCSAARPAANTAPWSTWRAVLRLRVQHRITRSHHVWN